MNWKYLSKRRKITLESFLSGVSSVDEALKLFSDKQIDEPPVDEIKKLFKKPAKIAVQEVPSEISQIAEEKADFVRKLTTKKTKNVKEQDQSDN